VQYLTSLLVGMLTWTVTEQPKHDAAWDDPAGELQGPCAAEPAAARADNDVLYQPLRVGPLAVGFHQQHSWKQPPYSIKTNKILKLR